MGPPTPQEGPGLGAPKGSRCPRMGGLPPKYPGLVPSHPRAVSQCVPAHPVWSQHSPSVSHRDPDVPNSPEKRRCPDPLPSHPSLAHNDAGSPGTGSATPQMSCSGPLRDPIHRRDTGVPVRAHPHLTGARGVPAGPPKTPTQVQTSRPEPTSATHGAPQVPWRLEAPDPPRSPQPRSRARPGPHSPPGPDHLTARRREVDRPICAGGSGHTTAHRSDPSGHDRRVSSL